MKSRLYKFFFPHEENDYRPHALQRAALAGMVMLALISFSVANLHSMLWVSSNWLVSTILPAVLVEETNAARADEGYTPLVRNSVLDEAARLKAEDMAKGEYFSHWSPEGVSPWHWFNEANYDYLYAGENLAVHFTDSTKVVEAWLDSPTHRDNIMNGIYSEIGIGTAKGQYEGYDTVFVVQLFGTPKTLVTEPVMTEELVDDAPVEATESIEPPPEVAGVSEVEDAVANLTESGTVVYESFAETVGERAGEVENTVSSAVGNITSSPTFFSKMLTSPRLVLQIIYTLIGIMIAVALITSLWVEWRHRHSLQVAYAMAMLVLMVGLFQLHIWASGSALIA